MYLLVDLTLEDITRKCAAEGWEMPVSGDQLARQRPAPDPMVCPGCQHHGFACTCPILERCPNGHGRRVVQQCGSNSGFAGEGLWWANLQCGCQVLESGEVEP